MNKKVTSFAAALLATGIVLSTPAYADKNVELKNEKVEVQKEQNKGSKDAVKGQTQKLKSVDKQLDKITEKLVKYQTKMMSMKQQWEDELEEEEAEETLELAEEIAESAEVEKPIESTEEDDLTDEEIEEEVEKVDDDMQEHDEYIGKFNALKNRLQAVVSQLDVLTQKGMDTVVLTERYNRVATLQTEIDVVIASIIQLEQHVKEQIANEQDIEEKQAPEAVVPLTKAWKVKFNQTIDEQTLSESDMVVLNAQQNLVEVEVSYSADTQSVIITPLQPYKAGETYTLYIGKGIESKIGAQLKNAVKMMFTVK